jgi:hypothetical protein
MQASISTCSGSSLWRRSSIILLIQLKQNSEDTIETRTEKMSLAMIERNGNVSLWSRYQRSKSNSSSYAVTLSLSRYADSSQAVADADRDGLEAETGEGPTTPDAPGPPKILPHACFLLPVLLAGCVALL